MPAALAIVPGMQLMTAVCDALLPKPPAPPPPEPAKLRTTNDPDVVAAAQTQNNGDING